MNRTQLVSIILLLVSSACAEPEVSVIPIPVSVTTASESTVLGAPVTLSVAGPGSEELLPAVEAWLAERQEHLGVTFRVRQGNDPADISISVGTATDLGEEAYRLRSSSNAVAIEAAGPAGAFYALQTLTQLMTADGAGSVNLPATWIEDEPRFAYRGMHLDVARHFFEIEFVKRYIDLLSRYKMNRFHWHLTEDQGWRVEIEAYPRLTSVASCRSETIVEKNFDPFVGDGRRYCGFYTREEIREVVEYAAERFVTVIPEIEMPGHSLAALAAYPALSCGGESYEVGTRWGVYEDIYCPSEETFAFLEDVLSEVVELFPGEYIHIGGDEAPKRVWEESPIAQAVIEREGLADEHELQSYFIRRIESILAERGRRLIGWDEILEGGLAPDATVMSWRGTDGGIAAARQGHDVIMSPTSHVYFDYYQGDPETEPLAIGGFTPLEHVYSFEPVPDVLTDDQARHVLGAQANLWTEYITTPEHAEYMAYPRAIALAEILWSPRERTNWDSFRRRLPASLEHLDRLGVNYRPLDDQ